MDGKKIGWITLKVSIWFLVGVLVFLSLLPLVQWWAGVIAFIVLAAVAILSFLLPDFVDKIAIPPYRGWLKAMIVVFIFGFIMHLGCSVYSDMKIGDFAEDAHKEKNTVFEKTKVVQPPDKVIQGLNRLYQAKPEQKKAE